MGCRIGNSAADFDAFWFILLDRQLAANNTCSILHAPHAHTISVGVIGAETEAVINNAQHRFRFI